MLLKHVWLWILGDPHSRVYGSIFDGVFEGHVHTGDGQSFTIDKAAKYFDMVRNVRVFAFLFQV